MGGRRAHPQPLLAQEVARPVLEAALPLLAQLRRPQLLLDERRLQVVFKERKPLAFALAEAQRIILPAEQNGSESEYVGLWHVDGLREHIVAVVLQLGGSSDAKARRLKVLLSCGPCAGGWRHGVCGP